jgi:hypothetical protein
MTAPSQQSHMTNMENVRAAATIILLAAGWFGVVMFTACEILRVVE